MDPETIYDLSLPGSVAVSPDGSRVAFTVRETDPEDDQFRHALYVVPTDGSREPHRLTRASDASAPAWGPDGDRLAFTAVRDRDTERVTDPGSESVDGAESEDDETTSDDGSESDDGDDERGSDESATETDDEADGSDEPQVWLFDLALGGDARQVTDHPEGVSGFDWGPDGERLVIAARDPTDDQQAYTDGVEDGEPYEITRIQHRVDGRGLTDDVRTYLFVVDLDTGERRRLDEAYARGASSEIGGMSFAWGADRIAFTTYRGEEPDQTFEQDVFTLAPDGSDLRRVTDGGLSATGLTWTDDGRLWFVASDANNVHDPRTLRVFDGERVVERTATLDRTAMGGPIPTDDGVLVTVGDEGLTRLVHVPDDGPVERTLPAQGTDRTLAAADADGGRCVVVLDHPGEGRDLYSVATDALADPDAELTRLTALNDDLLTETATPTCHRVRYENADGGTVEGLVWLPEEYTDPAEVTDPLPLVVHIHGGPTAYDAPHFSLDYTHWTAEGYAVLNVNYRGSTSYGKVFSESIRGDWGPRERDDILSGVDELVDRGVADPDRLFVSGFSQGGINTLYVVTHDDRFAAAAPEHGIYDFTGLFGHGDMHQWYVNDLGGPWENPEGYRRISSLPDIDRANTPLLVTAGENDYRCPLPQAERLHVSARRCGVESKLVVYQGENHSIGAPDRAVHRLETLTDWFQTHDPATDD